MPLDLSSLNPQQQMMLMALLRGGGGMGAPQQGMPGMPAPGLTPQQALMQKLQNPQASPMQQLLQQMAQVQQGQQQTLNAVSQPNPLLQQLSPQLQALLRVFNGQMPQGVGVPQSSGVTST